MNDYLLERKLRAEDSGLHMLMKSSIFALENVMNTFLKRFPSFTDHSILHTMNVLNYSNMLISPEAVEKLTAQECYILIMSCYLHDMGMVTGEKDYAQFMPEIVPADYLQAHPEASQENVIRAFHHEFSACLIRKYADLFEIPEEFVDLIADVSRGHRITDLLDEREFPIPETERGPIRLPYLAAVLRLADEIDVGADRNPALLYADVKMLTQKDVEAFGTHDSITNVEVKGDRIVFTVKPKAPEFIPMIRETVGKAGETLAYCREAALKRTGILITQERVEVLFEKG